MDVVRNTDTGRRVSFSSLDVGDAYETDDGYICIKTAEGIGYRNCIIYYGYPREWETGEEDINAHVRPLKSTLTIEGEEED